MLQKLVALMGASPGYHERLFFKFQSITVRGGVRDTVRLPPHAARQSRTSDPQVPNARILLDAFPDTPWIFVYRGGRRGSPGLSRQAVARPFPRLPSSGRGLAPGVFPGLPRAWRPWAGRGATWLPWAGSACGGLALPPSAIVWSRIGFGLIAQE